MNIYRTLVEHRGFTVFWLSFTVSVVGDSLTVVALNWYVFDLTGSPTALGWLSFCLMAPIVVGGLVAGWVLDRFDRLGVMMLDSLFKALMIASLPVAAALGRLELWHIYLVASVHGFLMMIPLAGVPSMLPRLVPEAALNSVNALETLSYTLSGILGPLSAGILITLIGPVNVLAVDAATFAVFALTLLALRRRGVGRAPATASESGQTSLSGAFRLIFTNKVLSSTTLMYLTLNVGLGVLLVVIPVFSTRELGGGPALYGYMLSAIALGEVLGSVLITSVRVPFTIGTAICLSIVLAGASLAALSLAGGVTGALASLLMFGVFTAPLTIWGQTLRMKVIPPEYYGRCFAIMRTFMQSGTPSGGLLAGFGIPLLGVRAALLVAAVFVLAPGAAGFRIKALRRAQ